MNNPPSVPKRGNRLLRNARSMFNKPLDPAQQLANGPVSSKDLPSPTSAQSAYRFEMGLDDAASFRSGQNAGNSMPPPRRPLRPAGLSIHNSPQNGLDRSIALRRSTSFITHHSSLSTHTRDTSASEWSTLEIRNASLSSATGVSVHDAEYAVPAEDSQDKPMNSFLDMDENDEMHIRFSGQSFHFPQTPKFTSRPRAISSRPRPTAMLLPNPTTARPLRPTPLANLITDSKSYGVYLHPANQALAHLLPHPGRGFRAAFNESLVTVSQRLGQQLSRRKGYSSCRWEPSIEFTISPERATPSHKVLLAETVFSLTQGVMTNDKHFYGDYWNSYYSAPIVDILSSFAVPKDPIAALVGPNATFWQESFEHQISQVHIIYDEEKGLRFNLRDEKVEEVEQNSRANKRLERVDNDAKYKYTPRPIADLLYFYQVLYPGIFLMVYDPSPSSASTVSGTKRVRIRALPPKAWFSGQLEAMALIQIVGHEYYQQCVDAAFDTYDAGEDGGEWVDVDGGLF